MIKIRVTLQMVAREAKCSTTAVSLVLNGKNSKISEETRKAILEAAEKLNYHPNRLAAGLSSRKTHLLGLIIPDNCNSFFGMVSKYTEMQARKRNYQILYGNSFNILENDIRLIHTFADYCIDGILMVRANCADADADHLCQVVEHTRKPVVLLDRPLEGANLPTFMTDNALGGRMATEALIRRGHRRIGCYAGPKDIVSAQQRLKGYRDALEQNGIAYDPDLVIHDSFAGENAEAALEAFVQAGVTALFTGSDHMAYAMYRSIQLKKMRIPQDISIIGFDDLEYDLYMVPALASVSQPIEQMCADAVDYLINQIEGLIPSNVVGPVQYYSPSVIERDSLGMC